MEPAQIDSHRPLERSLAPNRARRRVLGWLLIPAVVLILLPTACQSSLPKRNPTGERFPSVRGESLTGESRRIPESLDGPAVILIGYDQDAQFDADRWLLGLLQAETPGTILELPTIPGLFPRVFSGSIDSGMRGGIPEEDWASVVTLYGDDATTIAAFTGNEAGQNIRTLLLDAEGRVLWFHDRGYSAGKLLELDRLVREQTGTPRSD